MTPLEQRHREVIDDVIAGVRRACDPAALVAKHVGDLPSFSEDLEPMVAIGKAAASMISGMLTNLMEDEIDWSAWRHPIVVPHGAPVPDAMRKCKTLYTAAHPLPDASSREVGKLLRHWRFGLDLSGRSRIWLLLSGGASSLMIDPPPQIGVDDYRAVVQALLLSGASIEQLNTVRKHIDFVKGGWLARWWPARDIRLLAMSDVIGDDLSVIGSGPVSPDQTTFQEALDILERMDCADASSAATEWLRAGARGEHPETPKPGDPDLERVTTFILASNRTAIAAACTSLESWNIHVVERVLDVTSSAHMSGESLASRAIQVASTPGKTSAIVLGGETTVRVEGGKGAGGKGGRNQELALAAAIAIDGRSGVTIASFGTDGVDGPTDAAGAIVTGDTCRQARALGLDPAASLARHDSYTFFEALDKAGHPHLIRTGPTGTNVNDIAMALMY